MSMAASDEVQGPSPARQRRRRAISIVAPALSFVAGGALILALGASGALGGSWGVSADAGARAGTVSSATSFVTTWDTSDNPRIVLPLVDPDGGVDEELSFTIDWGDGTTEAQCMNTFTSIAEAVISHSYVGNEPSSTITISGDRLPGWSAGAHLQGFAPPEPGYRGPQWPVSLLQSVDQWGGFRFGNPADIYSKPYFAGASSLTSVPADEPPGLDSLDDLSSMFAGATSFNSDISNWDTSGVTNMTGMFMLAEMFDQDLSSWCVSQIATTPDGFTANAAWDLALQPQWGTCPG